MKCIICRSNTHQRAAGSEQMFVITKNTKINPDFRIISLKEILKKNLFAVDAVNPTLNPVSFGHFHLIADDWMEEF